MVDLIGWWDISVPLSQEESKADMAVLAQISIPEEATLKDAEIVIHGRIYRWHSVELRSY